jgi:ligand-binding SRPBCC domain-containing protein
VISLELVTEIAAPVERCFDLACSIDLHTASTDWSGERAVAGVTSGLIGLGQEVTWQGRHFGFYMTHTSQITKYQRPHYFQDRMVQGKFRSFCHDHFFKLNPGGTLMTDVLQFEAPLGILGGVVEKLLLKRHMEEFLLRRNQQIRLAAEGEDWRRYLR